MLLNAHGGMAPQGIGQKRLPLWAPAAPSGCPVLLFDVDAHHRSAHTSPQQIRAHVPASPRFVGLQALAQLPDVCSAQLPSPTSQAARVCSACSTRRERDVLPSVTWWPRLHSCAVVRSDRPMVRESAALMRSMLSIPRQRADPPPHAAGCLTFLLIQVLLRSNSHGNHGQPATLEPKDQLHRRLSCRRRARCPSLRVKHDCCADLHEDAVPGYQGAVPNWAVGEPAQRVDSSSTPQFEMRVF